MELICIQFSVMFLACPPFPQFREFLLVDHLQILVEPQSEVAPPLNTFIGTSLRVSVTVLGVRAWYRDVDVLHVRKVNQDRILAVLSMSAYMTSPK